MDEAGDGTTTATLLAREIYRDGLWAVSAGYHPLEIRNEMIEAAEKVIDNVIKMSIKATSID